MWRRSRVENEQTKYVVNRLDFMHLSRVLCTVRSSNFMSIVLSMLVVRVFHALSILYFIVLQYIALCNMRYLFHAQLRFAYEARALTLHAF